MGTNWSTFDHEAKEWIFTALPLQVARGNRQVRLFQGDRSDADIANGLLPTPIFSEDIPVTAGVEVTRTFTRTFPGGDQYYWLFVDIRSVGSNDVIYTTPIFLSSSP